MRTVNTIILLAILGLNGLLVYIELAHPRITQVTIVQERQPTSFEQASEAFSNGIDQLSYAANELLQEVK